MITTIFQVVTVLHQGETSSGKRRENWVESCGKTFTFFLLNLYIEDREGKSQVMHIGAPCCGMNAAVR